MTFNQFCKLSINLQSAKQGLFSVIPEAAVHSNFTVNLARCFRTPIRAPRDNRLQIKCSKKSRQIDWKTPVLGSPLIRLQASDLQLYQKVTSAQVFSCEYFIKGRYHYYRR